MSNAKFISVLGILLASMVIAIGLVAQQDSAQPVGSAPPPTAPALRVTTHLVLLDVIATGKDGKPVSDLKKEDFKVEENGKTQNVAMFSLNQPTGEEAPPEAPAGVFTNRPAYHLPENGATILLIDGLNSPFSNQSYARYQMMKYASTQLAQNRPTAVFALGNELVELQSFTTDPVLLQRAIAGYHPVSPTGKTTLAPVPQSTAVLAQGDLGRGAGGGAAAAQALASMSRFTTEITVSDLQFRIDHTLAAMHDLAAMVAGQAGRKNLVWLTAGLPFSLIPSDNEQSFANVGTADPTAGDAGAAPPLAVNPNGADAFAMTALDMRQEAAKKVKRAAALLATEQIAIYPVDVRGLVGSVEDASNATSVNGSGFGSGVIAANAVLEGTQATLEDLATQTGGKLYKNRNDIGNAVAEAAVDGATYYELGYYPEKPKFDGSYHRIKVSVNRPGLLVRYRPGYFAIDPNKGVTEKDRKNDLVMALASPSDSSMVMFDAQVSPQAGEKEMPVRMLVRPDSISASSAKDGKRQIDVDYFAVAVTDQGRQAAMQGKTVKAALDGDQYASMMKQGLLLSLAMPTLPPGHYDLRLAVRDNQTGYIGTIHAPIDVPK
jgi:VWFA-related protein